MWMQERVDACAFLVAAAVILRLFSGHWKIYCPVTSKQTHKNVNCYSQDKNELFLGPDSFYFPSMSTHRSALS